MIRKPLVHSKQHERSTPVRIHIVSTWLRSGSVELLAFGRWRVVVSIVVYSGSGWKQQASSIDSPEKQRLTIEKFLQANVHGAGDTHGR